MTGGRASWPIAILAVLFTTVLPVRADQVEPPLEVLYAPANMLVTGKLIEINPTGRLVFARGERLSGKQEPPQRIDVGAPKSTLATVKLGDDYIFAYTMYARDPYRPDKVVVDPHGAMLRSAPGLEPALFHDNRTTRAIIGSGAAELEHEGAESTESARKPSGRDADVLLQRLFGALHGDDAALQNLAAHEIALSPELAARLGNRDRLALEAFVRNSKALPSARTALLLAAAREPAAYGSWWSKTAQQILASTPTGGYADATSDPSGLVLAAFEVLELHKITLRGDSLERWVSCGYPSLAEHALLALRHQAPEKEKPAIEKALADPGLSPTTRKFLTDHLRRLNLLNARLGERKEGFR